MQTPVVWNWRGWAMGALLLAVVLPGLAQVGPPVELRLNGIRIGSTYVDVLKMHGIPTFVGPAKTNADEVMGVLDPTELATEAATVAASVSTPGGTSTVDEEAMRLQQMTIWEYFGTLGNARAGRNPNGGWVTLVFINGQGTVVGVCVTLTKAGAKPPIETESGVSFGTRMMDIVSGKGYDWPDPLRRVDGNMFLSYPNKDVAFTVSSTTRRVICMSVGMPLSIMMEGASAGDTATSGAHTLPGLK